MNASEIESGATYVIKTDITGNITAKVTARPSDLNFPFEISAAQFGITAKEVVKKAD